MSDKHMKDHQAMENPPTPRPQGKSRLRAFLKRWSLSLLALAAVGLIVSVLVGKLRNDVWAYFSDGEGTRVEVQEEKTRMVLWEDPKPNYFQEKGGAAEAKQADSVNGPTGQLEAAFSADGTRMILVRWDENRSNANLYQSSWDGRLWSQPQAIQSINTAANERGPGLSGDGNYLFFASDRKGGLGGYDLYVARWDGKGWTGVETLGASVNSAADEAGPALSADDSQLYFSSKRAGAEADDIYVAQRIATQASPDPKAKPALREVPSFSPAEPVKELNSAASDLRAVLTKRGDHVFLASDRDRNDQTGYGIYISRVVGGKALPPEKLDFYIDKGDVTDPAVRMDGFDLLFSADSKAAAALEGSQNPAEGYRLYRTTTREVFGYTNLSRWLQFQELLHQIGWRLLLALAALIALIYLLEKWRDLTSLYHKCLAGSAAVHLLILLLMMIWQVTQNLDSGGEAQAADIAISIDALAQEELALESTPEEAKLSDTPVAVITDKVVSDFVIPDFKPVQPSDAPPIVTSTAKESMIQDIRASKANLSPASEPILVPTDQRELANDLPESQLPELELPQLPELTSADPAEAAKPADTSEDIFRPTGSVAKVTSQQAKTLAVAETAVQKSTETQEITRGNASAATTDTGGNQVVAHAGLEAKGAPPQMDGAGTKVTTLLNIAGPDSTTDPLLPDKLETPKHEIDPKALTKHVQKQRGRPSLETIEALGGSDVGEKAIGAALDWLVRNQESDGRWDTRKHGAKGAYDTAGTGAALLCFYGWGLSHTGDGKYQPQIKKALDWLVAQQLESGELSGGATGPGRMYCHGIATIALCEAYGATKDLKLKAPAEKAIALILASQSPTRGGWRYQPVDPNGLPSQDSDTSVTGWQYMALHSAKMADMEVPQSAFDLAGKWFTRAGGGKFGGLYGYDGPARSNPAMVATGMFCRQLDLIPPTDPMMQESAEYLKMQPMNVRAPDLYQVYYTTLALYQHQGPIWLAWNEKLKEVLPLIQRKGGAESGSWDANGQHIAPGGRVVSTAFATLSLEVYYRLLPMYGFRNEDAPPAKAKTDQ
jgi:hypothetical protein